VASGSVQLPVRSVKVVLRLKPTRGVTRSPPPTGARLARTTICTHARKQHYASAIVSQRRRKGGYKAWPTFVSACEAYDTKKT
jgi:hypothetical protein